jgi:CO dehydrogenase nickel-insertion accessory protein CooC1
MFSIVSQGVVSLAFLHDGRSAPKVLGTEIKNDALLTEEPKSKSKPSVVKSKIQKTKTKKKSTILKSEKQVSVVAAIPHTPEVDKQEFEGKKENWFTKLWNKIMKKQNHD